MIESIELHHFKCFEDICLPLGPLTLLSGTNAAGKSSCLQALVLLHQTMREHEWSTRLVLNGSAIRLGTVKDVVDKVHGRRHFEISLREPSTSLHWAFAADSPNAMTMAVECVGLNGTQHKRPTYLRHLCVTDPKETSPKLAERLRSLTYITAERLGPREVYALEDRQSASVVGPKGENTVSVLERMRSEPIRPALRIPETARTGLRQVEAHMRRFFPGCRLDVQPVPQANALTLGIATSDETGFHRPVHVGFGITQVLPIIVAALSAEKDGLLLIENPEVHLHPAGQALMGTFLAEVAAAGTQVILETHSDHVLNGIRRAVRAGTLPHQDALLHFFRPRGGELDQVESPALDADGNVDVWPEGFFDQFDKDMNHFAGWD
ncbi:MAG TPA: DUF3696 domain-containing protein [Nannocystis exedens]|nr:DUF3696 domain-containing protein [Nannocystis exedens]